MNKSFRHARLVLSLSIFCSFPSQAEDWPCWRGPTGQGIWNHPGELIQDFKQTPAEVVWRTPIRAGYSGVTTIGKFVFTMDRPTPTDKKKTPDGTERVLCFDRETGKIVWQYEYPAHYGDLDYGIGPRANVTLTRDGFAFTLGAVGHAHCFEAKTGRVVWSRDLAKEASAQVPTWGFSASPVVAGDGVLFHVGAKPSGTILRLSRRTGEEISRTGEDPAGYATPVIALMGEQVIPASIETIESTQSGLLLIAWTPTNVLGIDLLSSKLLWSIPYKVTYGVSIATPIVTKNIVLVSGYWEGTKAIQLDKNGSAKILWEDNRNLRGLMAPPLFDGSLVYLLDKQFGTTCFDLMTGVKKWDDNHRLTPKGRNPQATLVWSMQQTGQEMPTAKSEIVALNSDGEVVIASMSEKGFFERTRAKIIGETWANPAFADDSIFARSDTEIVRVRLIPKVKK